MIPKATLLSRAASGLIAAGLLALLPGCPIEYGPVKPPDPDVTYSERCSEICDEQTDEPIPTGCIWQGCGVNAGNNPTADQRVIDLDAPGPSGTCEGLLLCTCEGLSWCPPEECFDGFLDCAGSNNSVTGCYENGYESCLVEIDCQEDKAQCEEEAAIARDECKENSPTAEGDEGCEQFYDNFALPACQCVYEECLVGDEDHDNCFALPLLPPPPPLPLQTGPQRWTVSRVFIDRQLDRLGAARAETLAWPLRAPTGQWQGLRLRSVDADEPLYALGVRNNDLLVTVNGVPIKQALENPDQLLALRNANVVFVVIRRAGVLRQHRYDLIP
jgi:hypothetical protein